MQTARTSLGGVTRIDMDNLYPCSFCFVIDLELQLSETPFMDRFRFSRFSNSVQVFKNDPLFVLFRVFDDLFADLMVHIGDESSFSTRDTQECSFRTLATVGLKISSSSFKTCFLMSDFLCIVELLVRSDSSSIDSQINPKTSPGRIGSRRGFGNGKMQIEFVVPDKQLGRADIGLTEFAPQGIRHLQLTCNSSLRTNGQRNGITILPKFHGSGVISNRRVRFEFMPLRTVSNICSSDFCDSVDHMLRWKFRFFPNQIVSLMVNIIFTMQVL